MKNLIIFVLTVGLLYPQLTLAQIEEPRTPAYVYVIGAGTTLIAGSIWAYRNFVKSPAAKKHKSLKQQALDEIAYLATAAEKKALKRLNTPEQIQQFLAAFWERRDPSPNTEENELREEFHRRRDYANAHFGKEGWKTDRGRVYILHGPPDDIEQLPMINVRFGNNAGRSLKALELWIYSRPANGTELPNIFSSYNPGAVKFVFADLEGAGCYTQIYSSEKGEVSDPRVYVSSSSAASN
jgi:GWxTD domain-containing protein